MVITVETVDTLTAELQSMESQLAGTCAAIAGELRKPPPHDGARLVAATREITRINSLVATYFQKLAREQRRESERLAALVSGNSKLEPAWQTLSIRAGLVRTWLNQWPRIEPMLRQQIPSRRRKLYRSRPRTDSTLQTQVDIGDRLLGALHALANPHRQSEAARDFGCYEDVALPGSQFLEHAHAAYRLLLARQSDDRTSFVDIGCGGGVQVLSALAFFDQATGIEFDKAYAASARRLLRKVGSGPSRIIQTDATRFRRYSQFDVVYFYRPMRALDDLVRLETAIVEGVRPGTLLIAPYRGFHDRHKEFGCPKIDGSIYLAKSSAREATRLRRRAEYTGAHVSRNEPHPGLRSIWDPVLMASRANGFGLEVQRPAP